MARLLSRPGFIRDRPSVGRDDRCRGSLVAHWRVLDAEERARAFELLADGRIPTADDYARSVAELRAEGVEIAPRSQVIRHFDSWEGAKEALTMWQSPSKMTTARRIEARFKARRMGKVWRYTPETLAATMAHCVADHGRPPRVAEYDWWRRQQLELAHATGDPFAHLPSANPYRKRWRTWDAALVALGYSPEWIAERLEDGVLVLGASAKS